MQYSASGFSLREAGNSGDSRCRIGRHGRDSEHGARRAAIWLNPGFYAFHFDRDKDLRDDNIGFGVEVVVAPDHAVGAGGYVNGNRTRSRYAAYAWRPLHWRAGGADVLLGVVAGAFDGYPNYRNRGWLVAPLPLLAIEGQRLGVNLSVIPTIRGRVDGAIVIQLKLRVW